MQSVWNNEDLKMEIYLVGGAVRDELLGLPVQERDWVVVGGTVAEMLALGYRQVGKDFPVFLHPKTQEEYALARIERKVGRGYTGFHFDTGANVSLEEDLLRRDLTINAIAKNSLGQIIDPYQGKNDIEKKLLRHVSPAFAEDPVRILRVARFAARFAELGFVVAPETLELMKTMVTSGEINALVSERIWKELERALQEKNPEAFFIILENCSALAILFPELKKQQLTILIAAAKLSNDAEVRFATLWCDCSAAQIKQLCARFRAPSSYRELALLVATHYEAYLQAHSSSAESLLDLLQATDAFRREERFMKFLLAAAAIAQTTDKKNSEERLLKAYDAARAIKINVSSAEKMPGKEIAAFIKKQRLDAISKVLAN
jgi:tRNA nucleotidyltransferase (CCA-adding enzyme)